MMQFQSSLSLGSSGSNNSTFFKSQPGDVTYSISNITEETGLLSTLTRTDEEEEDNTTTSKKQYETKVGNDPRQYWFVKTRTKSENASQIYHEKTQETNSDMAIKSDDAIVETKSLIIPLKRGRSRTSRGTVNSDRSGFKKSTMIQHPEEIGSTKLTEKETGEETEQFSQNRAGDDASCTRFATKLAAGINAMHDGVAECAACDKFKSALSPKISYMVDGMKDIELKVIDYCEPTSLKDNNLKQQSSDNTKQNRNKAKAGNKSDNRKTDRRNTLNDDSSSLSYDTMDIFHIPPMCCSDNDKDILMGMSDRSLSPEKSTPIADERGEPSPAAITRERYLYPFPTPPRSNHQRKSVSRGKKYKLLGATANELRNAGTLMLEDEQPPEETSPSKPVTPKYQREGKVKSKMKEKSPIKPSIAKDPNEENVLLTKKERSSSKPSSPKDQIEEKTTFKKMDGYSRLNASNKVSFLAINRKKASLAKKGFSISRKNWRKTIYSGN